MKETAILYTNKKSGRVYHMFSNLSYLDKDFFDENPVKPPEVSDMTGASMSMFRRDSKVTESL